MLPEFLANHPSIQAALPILIDAALKGAILVAIAAIAALVLRNRPPLHVTRPGPRR